MADMNGICMGYCTPLEIKTVAELLPEMEASNHHLEMVLTIKIRLYLM